MDMLSLHQRIYERTDGRLGLWKLVNDTNYGRYDRYQTRTERQIALVVVTPAAPEVP